MIKDAHRKLDFLVVGVAPAGALLMLIWFAATASGPTRRDMATTCAKAGYPELIYPGGEPYCHRLLNGTDELVPVEQVRQRIEKGPECRPLEVISRLNRGDEIAKDLCARVRGEPGQPSTPETEHPTMSEKEPQ